ncbi:MAG: response regulator transcription factor [Peptostreptococcaceae bacterium]
MITILIVDDEEMICEFIEAYLNKENYKTIIANNGKDAIDIVDSQRIDLIILDRMLPDISGEEICKYIKKSYDTPIIMVTSKTEDEDKIDGFNLGCDDYICKPFNPKEMVLRVKAMLRRCRIYDESIISFKNGLEIDKLKRIVKINSEEIELTKTEYEILYLLSSNPGKIYTREQILQNTIEESYEKLDRAVDNHIKNIRKKLEEHLNGEKIIKTIYGVGYKFEEQN